MSFLVSHSVFPYDKKPCRLLFSLGFHSPSLHVSNPNHLNLFSIIFSSISATPISPCIQSFHILSFLVPPYIHLNILISTFFISLILPWKPNIDNPKIKQILTTKRYKTHSPFSEFSLECSWDFLSFLFSFFSLFRCFLSSSSTVLRLLLLFSSIN